MTIQWFPGHMAKAMREIREKLKLVDAVIEVLDARAPKCSINDELKEMIKDKPLLFALNKCDLADKKETSKWVKELSKEHLVVSLNSLNGKDNIALVTKALEELLKEKNEKMISQGKNPYPLKVMVCGIPNVGKSTLMNNVAKRKAMKTGNKPGITKNQQFLKANDKLLLLDNPGILWPKFKNDEEAKNLALIGSIRDEILPLDDISIYGLNLLAKYYPEKLKERYDIEETDDPIKMLNQIGKKRGALLKGGEIDYDKVYALFLYDLRNGKLGEITLERIDWLI